MVHSQNIYGTEREFVTFVVLEFAQKSPRLQSDHVRVRGMRTVGLRVTAAHMSPRAMMN